MRYDYVVTLKKTSAKITELTCLLACLLSAAAFAIVQIRTGQLSWILLAGTGGLTVAAIILSIASSRGRPSSYSFWLFLAGVCWLAMPFLRWLIVPFAALGIFERQVSRALEIGFSPGGIVLNSIIKKRFAWAELDSVVLKDGILTLDFRNNRLIQQEVLDDDEPEADEDEFNLWCRAQLKITNN